LYISTDEFQVSFIVPVLALLTTGYYHKRYTSKHDPQTLFSLDLALMPTMLLAIRLGRCEPDRHLWWFVSLPPSQAESRDN